MPLYLQVTDHPTPTARSGLRYQFTPKHHGQDPSAAQWLPTLTAAQEFSVFDLAGAHEVCCHGNLYGILREEGAAGCRDLGTCSQQVAKFPECCDGRPWHGYPVWAVEGGPKGLSDQRHRPPKEVFALMAAAGLLSSREKKRLMGGNHI